MLACYHCFRSIDYIFKKEVCMFINPADSTNFQKLYMGYSIKENIIKKMIRNYYQK